MGHTPFRHFVCVFFGVIASAAMLVSSSSAAVTYQVVYNFTGGLDGGNAATGLVFDQAGNAYGTTVVGGLDGCGTAFKLTPRSTGQWHESVLWSFSCFNDGKNPHGGLTFDSAGALFGTAVAGGTGGFCTGDGCGVVFRVSQPHGIAVLYNFKGGFDGFGPGNPVAFDSHGNLYGDTPDGGKFAAGTVYRLSHSGGVWRKTTIHNFTGGSDGGTGSLGRLLIGANGNVFGTTETGGANSAGTVFRISQEVNDTWHLKTLYAFRGGRDATSPYGGLIADANHNLYGTTYFGGEHGAGAVYELSPAAGDNWSERVLYSFQGGTDGSKPTSTLVADANGNLLGTTTAGGRPTCNCGTVFMLDPRTGTETVVHRFGFGLDGSYPLYGLTFDPAGNLVSATPYGGQNGQGTVFELKP